MPLTSLTDHLKHPMIASLDYYLSYLGPIVQHYNTNVRICARNDLIIEGGAIGPCNRTTSTSSIPPLAKNLFGRRTLSFKSDLFHVHLFVVCDTTYIATGLILHHSLSPGGGGWEGRHLMAPSLQKRSIINTVGSHPTPPERDHPHIHM